MQGDGSAVSTARQHQLQLFDLPTELLREVLHRTHGSAAARSACTSFRKELNESCHALALYPPHPGGSRRLKDLTTLLTR